MSDFLSYLIPGLSIGSGILGAVQNNRSAQTQANALLQAAQMQAQAQQQAAQLQAQGQQSAIAAQQQGLQSATDTTNRNSDNALNFLRYAYDQSRADTAPWRQQGAAALGNAAGQFNQPFAASPGYAFARDEGIRAIQNGMAAKGLLNSTAAGRALARYGTQAASQEYGNYANRLMQLAGLGQTAAGQGAAASQGFGNSAAGVASGVGNTLAGLQSQYGINIGNLATGTANNLSNLATQTAQGIGGLTAQAGTAQANGANQGVNSLMQGANGLLSYWAMQNNPFTQMQSKSGASLLGIN